jgi:hypothetical protein
MLSFIFFLFFILFKESIFGVTTFGYRTSQKLHINITLYMSQLYYKTELPTDFIHITAKETLSIKYRTRHIHIVAWRLGVVV